MKKYEGKLDAKKLKVAIEMDENQARLRMRKMREQVAKNNIYRWAAKVLSELLKFEFKE